VRVSVNENTGYTNASNVLLYLFYLWTFVLIARPQDFIDTLRHIRPALSIGIAVLILFSIHHSQYRSNVFSNRQCRLYQCLLMTMIISIPFACYRRGAFEFFFTKYILTAIFFFLFYKIIDDAKKISFVIGIACFGTSMYLMNALYSGEMVSGRLKFGDMLDPNDMAFFAISFLPFNLLFLSKENNAWKKLVSVINLVLGIMVILMTGSRGGIIALSIVLLMLLFARSQIMKLSYKIIIIVMTAVALIYGGSMIDLSRYKTIIDIGEDYNVWDETGRMEIWNRGIDLMLSSPLTGVGVSCFSEAIGQQRKEQGLQELWQSPHNSLIQIGAETGILGLILFVLISYRAYRIYDKPNNSMTSDREIKISKLAKMSFSGHFVSSMFLSQAYSLYWVFFIALSAILIRNGSNTRSSL